MNEYVGATYMYRNQGVPTPRPQMNVLAEFLHFLIRDLFGFSQTRKFCDLFAISHSVSTPDQIVVRNNSWS
jgi:hypothetical protein